MRIDTLSVLIMIILIVAASLAFIAYVMWRRSIKAKRPTDQSLQVRESGYRDIFENALDIVYTLDRHGTFTSINESGEQTSSLLSETAISYAALPLQTPDRVSGLLLVSYNQHCSFPPDIRQIIQIVTSHTAVALANSNTVGEPKRAATTDPLTGLPNHRHLMDRLDEETARARTRLSAFR